MKSISIHTSKRQSKTKSQSGFRSRLKVLGKSAPFALVAGLITNAIPPIASLMQGTGAIVTGCAVLFLGISVQGGFEMSRSKRPEASGGDKNQPLKPAP